MSGKFLVLFLAAFGVWIFGSAPFFLIYLPMYSKNYSTQGLVLASKNYGESDKILIILTRKFGRMGYLVKGVRLLKSRKRGSLGSFAHISFQARESSSLHYLTEVEGISNFEFLKKDLKKMSVAYFFAEIVGKTLKEAEPHPEVFELLLKYLKLLKTSDNLKNLRNKFSVELLVLLGFWPKGKEMEDPDKILEQVLERKISSIRVGKKLVK